MFKYLVDLYVCVNVQYATRQISQMNISEPDQEWQFQIHQRIVRKDPTAFAELCEQALPHLVSFLEERFPFFETHLREMTAIDTLLDYQSRLEQYDPRQLSLFSYLRMAVRGDMLNAINKQERHNKKLLNIDDPHIQTYLSHEETIRESVYLDEWLSQHTELSSKEILQQLDSELSKADREIVLLMLDGVRDTHEYAAVMGISHLTIQEQRSRVKQAKDRLNKKIQRFANRLN